MNEREEIDMVAAEYVLGTLDRAELIAVAARRRREPVLNHAIRQWTRRMTPLLEHVQEVAPRSGLFAKIEAEIDRRSDVSDVSAPQVTDITSVRRQLARWRAAAIGASAVAAALAGFLILAPLVAPPENQRFVTVFQKGDQLPEFMLTIDLKTRELTIRPVEAPEQPGKTYQLWILAEQLGPAPKSLGLLDPVTQLTQKELSQYDPSVLRGATFGISIEPEGGSPTGTPTGPALHGKLYPTSL